MLDCCIYVTHLYCTVAYMYFTILSAYTLSLSIGHSVAHAYGVHVIDVRTLFLITLCQGYMVVIIYALVVRPTYIPIHAFVYTLTRCHDMSRQRVARIRVTNALRTQVIIRLTYYVKSSYDHTSNDMMTYHHMSYAFRHAKYALPFHFIG